MVSTGFTGGPGYSTFHFGVAVPPFNSAAAQLAVNRVRDAYIAGKEMFWEDWRGQVLGTVEGIDEASGDLVDAWAVTPANLVGSVVRANQGAAPVGAVTQWRTAGFVASHNVRGRTFHVPLNDASIDGVDGSINSTIITAATAFGGAMNSPGATDCVFGVYSRPFEPEEGDTRPARAGSFHGCTGYTVPDKAVILRSRRD